MKAKFLDPARETVVFTFPGVGSDGGAHLDRGVAQRR